MDKCVHSELNLKTHDDLILYGQLWEPQVKPKAVIVLSHGLSDRSERFVHWAIKFACEDYAFCCFDTRGNGKSEGNRGHCNKFEDFLLDIDRIIEMLQNRFIGSEMILYGHSMGGNVIANYLLKRRPNIRASIITSPWLKLTKEPNILVKILARMAFYIVPALDQKANINANHLTENKDVVQIYIDDPLIHDRITPAGFINISQAGHWAIKNASLLKTPTLLMQENGDRITSFEASNKFAKNAGNICLFKSWNGLYHELHNEPFRDEVFKYIINWLEQKA